MRKFKVLTLGDRLWTTWTCDYLTGAGSTVELFPIPHHHTRTFCPSDKLALVADFEALAADMRRAGWFGDDVGAMHELENDPTATPKNFAGQNADRPHPTRGRLGKRWTKKRTYEHTA